MKQPTISRTTKRAAAGCAPATCSAALPEWSDRLTARGGAPGEIIVRVPDHDEFGNWRGVNHIMTRLEAAQLCTELVTALHDVPPND